MYFGAASRHASERAVVAGAPAWVDICLRVQSPFRMHRCVYHVHAGVCECTRGGFGPFDHVFPWLCGGRGPHARAVRGSDIAYTKVTALPDSLGQCKLLQFLCVMPAAPPPCAFAAVPALRCCACAAAPGAGPHQARWMRRRRCCRSSAAPSQHTHGGRPWPTGALGGVPEPPGAAARLARRDASNIELAELPAAAEWPSLKYL